MSRASLLAQDLHERRCIGVENGYCERGGHHAKRFLPLAKEALAAPDPAVVIHDAFCDVQIGSVAHPFVPAYQGGCPSRAREIEWWRDTLGHYWATGGAS